MYKDEMDKIKSRFKLDKKKIALESRKRQIKESLFPNDTSSLENIWNIKQMFVIKRKKILRDLANGVINKKRDGYAMFPMRNQSGHRIIMERFLSELFEDRLFFLNSDQIVHHINGNIRDNRLDNLLLFKNNSKHLKFHALQNRLRKKLEIC